MFEILKFKQYWPEKWKIVNSPDSPININSTIKPEIPLMGKKFKSPITLLYIKENLFLKPFYNRD